MGVVREIRLGLLALFAITMAANGPAMAQQQQKPNILFIMVMTSAGCSRASTTVA